MAEAPQNDDATTSLLIQSTEASSRCVENLLLRVCEGGRDFPSPVKFLIFPCGAGYEKGRIIIFARRKEQTARRERNEILAARRSAPATAKQALFFIRAIKCFNLQRHLWWNMAAAEGGAHTHTHSDLWRLSAHKCSLCILTLSPVLSRSAVAFAVANKRGSADTTPSDAPTQPPSHPATLQIIKQPLEWRDGLFSAAELLDARRPPDRCKLLPRRLAPTSASVSQLITPTSPNHGICLRFNFVYGNVATAREF